MIIAFLLAAVIGVVAAPHSGAAPYASGGLTAVHADRILVKKAERRLYLLAGSQVLREYPISLGPNPVGPKFFAGDGRTPEGIYYIDYKNPSSSYYLSLKISYPNEQDIQNSLTYGLPAGGMIMIHGMPTDPRTGQAEVRTADWTEGCIAVSNAEIAEIWNAVDLGTVVEIQP